MRYSSEHKAETHQRILQAASKLFKREGFGSVSVERVMRGAGLTVGGFYAHFKSKQALLMESLREMLALRRLRWLEGTEDLKGEEFLSHFVRRYLSQNHRDRVEDGCPVPAIISEMSQVEPEVQAVFAEELDVLIKEVTARLGGGANARARAVAVVALCFGALSLSRATRGSALSDEVLEACRSQAEGRLPRRA